MNSTVSLFCTSIRVTNAPPPLTIYETGGANWVHFFKCCRVTEHTYEVSINSGQPDKAIEHIQLANRVYH